MPVGEKERRAKLAEWYLERDSSEATVEVATAFTQVDAWKLVDQGWTVDSESWQGGWRMGRDQPGWIILLSRPAVGSTKENRHDHQPTIQRPAGRA